LDKKSLEFLVEVVRQTQYVVVKRFTSLFILLNSYNSNRHWYLHNRWVKNF